MRTLMAIPMLLQPRQGRLFIVIGGMVPQLTADECGKEPTGIGGADETGMFGRGQKGEAFRVACANQSLELCLLEEDKEPRRITEIVGHDVLEGWGCGRVRVLLLSTSLAVRGEGYGVEGRGWSGGFRLWSGLLVFKLLKGFSLFLRKGW